MATSPIAAPFTSKYSQTSEDVAGKLVTKGGVVHEPLTMPVASEVTLSRIVTTWAEAAARQARPSRPALSQRADVGASSHRVPIFFLALSAGVLGDSNSTESCPAVNDRPDYITKAHVLEPLFRAVHS